MTSSVTFSLGFCDWDSPCLSLSLVVRTGQAFGRRSLPSWSDWVVGLRGGPRGELPFSPHHAGSLLSAQHIAVDVDREPLAGVAAVRLPRRSRATLRGGDGSAQLPRGCRW